MFSLVRTSYIVFYSTFLMGMSENMNMIFVENITPTLTTVNKL